MFSIQEFSTFIGGRTLTNLSKFRLKVFISSAMGEEDETIWMSIREAVKNKLTQCKYLEPFTIEEYATEIPSTQFFIWQVTQADVVVILVKDDIRPGTNQEIEKALEKGKPILVYFYNTVSTSRSVRKFKDFLISRDVTTFKLVNDFDDIDEIVLNDVINNLINYYRFTHDISNQEKKDSYFPSEEIFEDSILDKRFLDYFGNNQNTLIDIFSLAVYARKIEKRNDENVIGVKLLDWLYNGNYPTTNEELVVIWEELSLSENIIEILKLRHQSIQKYFDNDVEGALSSLDKAYEFAEETKVPNWLLGDILIDSRNIYSKLNLFENNYQKKINELSNFIYFPIGDRFLKEAFETLEKERITLRTLSPTTTRFGNTLLNSLQSVENYLYTSFMIGSSTHLLLARKKMIELLIEYGEIYKDENLIYQALRLMVLAGEAKMFSNILVKYWNEVSDVLAVNVEQLWDLTEVKQPINDKIMKCLIVKSLGQYMNNSLFRKAMTFLLQYSQEFEIHEKAMYLLDAINYNLKRLNNEFVFDMALNILKSDKIIIYKKITNLLSNVELSNCDDSDIEELSNILKEKLSIILKNNGDPYFIINLLKQRSNDFNDLYKLIGNEVSEDQLDYIEIELGNSSKEEKILVDSIMELEKRFSPNNGIQFFYSNDPLAVVIEIIKNFKSENLITLLNEDFIPLAIKVLSSDTSLVAKKSYLEALVTLLVEYKKEKKEFPAEIKSYFSTSQIELEDDLTLTRASVVSAKYYINTINSLLGIDTENNIFSTCVDYKEKSRNDREAFSYSIQKYIEYNLISDNKIPLFINLVVLEMLRDKYFVVRKNAIKCLILLYKSNPSNFLKGELIRMTLDSSPNVKGYFVSLLENNLIEEDFTKELLTLFSRDASYNIREASQKILVENIQ